MTDNGNGYRSRQHGALCRELEIRHLFTEPYRPRTNGKAERFIRTLTENWAYGAIYTNSAARRLALAAFIDYYNHNLPDRALGGQTPAQRLAERNNHAGAYTWMEPPLRAGSALSMTGSRPITWRGLRRCPHGCREHCRAPRRPGVLRR